MSSSDITLELIKQRRARVYRLYRAGAALDTIAQSLNMSYSAVRNDVQVYTKENLLGSLEATRQETLAIQLDRLQYFEERISPSVKAGDLKAVKLGLEITAEKNKLLGLVGAAAQQDRSGSSDRFPFSNYDLTPGSDDLDLESALAEADTEPGSPSVKVSGSRKRVPVNKMSDQELKDLYFAALNQIS
jgi:hypothetical protein